MLLTLLPRFTQPDSKAMLFKVECLPFQVAVTKPKWKSARNAVLHRDSSWIGLAHRTTVTLRAQGRSDLARVRVCALAPRACSAHARSRCVANVAAHSLMRLFTRAQLGRACRLSSAPAPIRPQRSGAAVYPPSAALARLLARR